MPLVAGLNPSIRLEQEPAPANDAEPIDVELLDHAPGEDANVTDDHGNILKIEHADGTITVSLDGKPVATLDDQPNPAGWFDNLAERMDDMQLGIIADDIIRGVEEDLQSRAEWMEQHVEGLKMLGFKPETPNLSADAADGAVDGTATVRHPMMGESVLRFWANACGEMLPADGPAKIHDDSPNSDLPRDQLADALQKDFNHFLTKVDRGYYASFKRMLLKLGFGGIGFRKVYYCPKRNRPVCETVDYADMIVSNDADSLDTARRFTQRVMMKPSDVKVMQLLGIYRDVDLGTPAEPNYDELKREEAQQQGVQLGTMRTDDRDREVYETYCERDIVGFEHKRKGKPTGLEVPYRITIDVSSRKVMALVRNYDKGTEDLPILRNPFVTYVFVPGFGFWPLGLLHIMSNMTNAATAAWRVMLDSGMFANFPGFLLAKSAARQDTLIFRVPPGGGAQVDTQGMKIGDAVMPLPYKTENMAALHKLTEDIVTQAQRIGMTAEMPAMEGREDTPATTILALIEQAQKMLSAVHKSMHESQAEEFDKILQCFKEHPESFWQCNRKPALPWDQETFLRAIDDCNLVPKADPNTASHMQRLMKVAALKYLQSQSPTLYDPLAVETAALQGIGYTNPQQFFAPPTAQAKPPPELEQKQAELQIKGALAQAQMIKAQAEAKKMGVEAELAPHKFQAEHARGMGDLQIKAAKTQIEGALKSRESEQAEERDLMAAQIQLVDLAQNIAVHPESAGLVAPLAEPAYETVREKQHEIRRKKSAGLAPPGMPPGAPGGGGG